MRFQVPPSIVQKLKEQFLVEWTYNSNAIEGNTLTLQETDLVLKRGLTIGNKSLKEYFEALNHKECIELIEKFVEKKEECPYFRRCAYIGRSIERSLVIYLNSLTPADQIKEHQGYISLKEATRYCDYSLEYLSLLARPGKLPAVKFERNWMTTREAIDTYLKKVDRKQKT